MVAYADCRRQSVEMEIKLGWAHELRLLVEDAGLVECAVAVGP